MTKKCSSKRLLFPWRRQPFSSISILDMLPLIPILWSILSVHAQNDAATTKIQDVSVPTYTLGPFNFSVSYRQDVCDRQAAFHAGNVTLRDALEGFQLRPYFLTGIPTLSSTDDDGSIPINTLEPSIRILDQLATRAKLTWRNSYGASSYVDALTIEQQQEQQQQQSESNRQNFDPYKANFDNVLNWATQSFDMSGNEFSKTVSRVANGNSFMEGHLDAGIIMVGKNVDETHKVDLFSFLKPFHWQVWLLIVFTMVVAGLVYQWMEWINEDSDRQVLQNSPTETIYFAALSFNGDIKFQPSTDYARVFVLLLAFWGLTLSSAYTANLASFLVIQNSPTLQVETVGEAVAANLPLCVVEGTFQESEVLKTYPEARLVAVPATSPYEIFTNVLNGRCQLAITPIYVWDNVKGNRTINADCKLKWVGRTFKFVRSGFSTRSDSGTLCTNLIRDVLSLHIGEMVDDGSLDAIYRQYHRSIHTIDCNRGTDTFLASEEEENTQDDIEGDGSLTSSLDNDSQSVQPLSLQDLGGLFIVIYCVGFLSCIAALISWHREKRKKRVQSAQKTIVENDLKLEESPCELESSDEEQIFTKTKNPLDSIVGEVVGREELLFKLENISRELEEIRQALVSGIQD